MRRDPLAPLLITGCDCCQRRRTCAPFRDLGLWLCRQCIVRVRDAGLRALDHFLKQGR